MLNKHLTLLIALFSFWLPDTAKGQTPFYPKYKQIEKILRDIEKKSPEIATLEKITESTHGGYTIYGLRVGRASTVSEDKPVWVFTGSLHGNERLGVRVVLNLAEELTSKYKTDPSVKKWVDAYEVWLIPTINPWGHDRNFRSNGKKTDKASSGVDMNRNYSFRWDQGGSDDPEDRHYRGSEALSEKETAAMAKLYRELQPVFGVTFHQGNKDDGGQIMVPWNTSRGKVKASPDARVLRAYANRLADWVFESRKQGALCETSAGGGYVLEDPAGKPCGDDMNKERFCKELCWRPVVTGLGPIGQSSNEYHAQAGTIDFTVELTHRLFNRRFLMETGKPESESDKQVLAIVTEITRNYTDAIKSWFDYFIHNSEANSTQFAGPGIAGKIVDVVSNKPLEATIAIEGFTHELMSERKSNASTGHFRRLLPKEGTYKIIVKAPGYREHTQELKVLNGALTSVDIQLHPLSP